MLIVGIIQLGIMILVAMLKSNHVLDGEIKSIKVITLILMVRIYLILNLQKNNMIMQQRNKANIRIKLMERKRP